MGHSGMDALNGALRDMRTTWERRAPEVDSVFGDSVTLRSIMVDTNTGVAQTHAIDMVNALRDGGVQVDGVKVMPSPHVRSVAEVIISVTVRDYVTETVVVEFDPGTDWGCTGRGHTLNTLWKSVDDFVILELDNGWSFTLPVKRADGPGAVERSVRAVLALHYRTLDMRDASEEDRESFVETSDDVPSFWETHGLTEPAPAPELAPEPVFTPHMAQPDARVKGPSLFCAPPANDFAADYGI